MRNALLMFTGIMFCCFIAVLGPADAQDNATTTTLGQEIRSDLQELKEERHQIKEDAQEAIAEEKALRQQIKEAIASGDKEKARQLKEQLKAIHHDNIREMKEDKAEVVEARQELQEDKKEAWNNLTPEEKAKIKAKYDSDNNPPGPKGGAGTNWENPPGPKGGPGASPNRKKK